MSENWWTARATKGEYALISIPILFLVAALAFPLFVGGPPTPGLANFAATSSYCSALEQYVADHDGYLPTRFETRSDLDALFDNLESRDPPKHIENDRGIEILPAAEYAGNKRGYLSPSTILISETASWQGGQRSRCYADGTFGNQPRQEGGNVR